MYHSPHATAEKLKHLWQCQISLNQVLCFLRLVMLSCVLVGLVLWTDKHQAWSYSSHLFVGWSQSSVLKQRQCLLPVDSP